MDPRSGLSEDGEHDRVSVQYYAPSGDDGVEKEREREK